MAEPGVATAERITHALVEGRIEIVTSLPDSWLTPLIARIDAEPKIRHVRVAREDDGAGICAGAALGGTRAALVCQNAGVLLSANALSGYAHNHQLGFLVLAVYRGLEDDRFHYQKYKGLVSDGVLAGMRIPVHVVDRPSGLDVISLAISEAASTPVVVLLRHAALFEGA